MEGETRTMKAVVFKGTHSIAVEDMPMPQIEDAKDVILKITSTAICGSDLHIYNGEKKKKRKKERNFPVSFFSTKKFRD